LGSAALLDSVARLLANDAEFLAFKGLSPESSLDDKAAFIVKEEETDGIVTSDSIPIVLIYTRPGKPDHRTTQVYIGKVVIDCFAADGNTARMMSDRTLQLMQNWVPDDQASFVCRHAYDTSFKTGIPGVKGHRHYYDISGYVG
jgi:hypothetical protein